jgi:prepilin peptidase CpaA
MLLSAMQSWSSVTTAMTVGSACVLLFAAWHDIVSRTVPNWVPLAIACCGVVAAYADQRLAISVAIGFAIFVVAALCWRRGWMGGADVKLLGAVAIILPPGMVSMFAVAMSLAGAVQAIIYLLARVVVKPPPPLAATQASPAIGHAANRRRPLVLRAARVERWRISRGGPLPYACAIAFGFLFVICNGAAP